MWYVCSMYVVCISNNYYDDDTTLHYTYTLYSADFYVDLLRCPFNHKIITLYLIYCTVILQANPFAKLMVM